MDYVLKQFILFQSWESNLWRDSKTSKSEQYNYILIVRNKGHEAFQMPKAVEWSFYWLYMIEVVSVK